MDEVTPETPVAEPSGDIIVVPLPDATAEPLGTTRVRETLRFL